MADLADMVGVFGGKEIGSGSVLAVLMLCFAFAVHDLERVRASLADPNRKLHNHLSRSP
jgi:hypothetical protein